MADMDENGELKNTVEVVGLGLGIESNGKQNVEADDGKEDVEADNNENIVKENVKADEEGEAVKADEEGTAVENNEEGEAVKADEEGEAVKADEEGEAAKNNEEGDVVKADEEGEAVISITLKSKPGKLKTVLVCLRWVMFACVLIIVSMYLHRIFFIKEEYFEIVDQLVRDGCIRIPQAQIISQGRQPDFSRVVSSLHAHMASGSLPVVCGMDIGHPVCVCLFRTNSGNIIEMVNPNKTAWSVEETAHEEWSHFCHSSLPFTVNRQKECMGEYYNLKGSKWERTFVGKDALHFQYLNDIQHGKVRCPRSPGR